MSSRMPFLILVVLALVPTAYSQSTTRLLIPLNATEPLPGANGSLWRTELVATNTGDEEVVIGNVVPDCVTLCEPSIELAPHETVILYPATKLANSGALLTVPAGAPVTFQLRVQDLSRQAETWGTALPVVREDQFHTGSLMLLDIPVSPDFRNTLRIYDPDNRTGAEVLVRVFAIGPHSIFDRRGSDVLLGERRLSMTQPPETLRMRVPGHAQVGDLSEIAPLANTARVNVEIVPLTSSLRIWSFVSVTNNRTQHVTAITPR